MYKKLLTTIFVATIFFLTQTVVYAQNKDLEKGLKLYAKKEYKLAIPVLKKYTHVISKLNRIMKLFFWVKNWLKTLKLML